MSDSQPLSQPVSLHDSQRGFVLIATLWVMVMLGILTTTMAYQASVEASVERHALDVSRLRLAARGGVHVAAASLLNTISSTTSSSPIGTQADEKEDKAQWQSIAIGDAVVSVYRSIHDASNAELNTVQQSESDQASVYGPDDQESRMNVNIATPLQLTGFPGISTVLAESIARHRRSLQTAATEPDETRDPDATNRADGSEPAVQLIQSPITTLDALLAVEGVTESLLYDGTESQPPLVEHLTTRSSGRVNVNTASEYVLAAVGLTDAQAALVTTQRKSAPWASVDALLSRFNIEPASDKEQRLQAALTTQSSTYSMAVVARIKDIDRDYSVQATLFNDEESARIVQWQER